MRNIRVKKVFYSLLISCLIAPSIATATATATATAGPVYIPKPDLPREKNKQGAEFGHAIARKGKYTLVGSDQNSELSNYSFNGLPDGNRNYDHGAIYLITDDNAEQTKKYQFLKDTVPLDASNFAYMDASQNFGAAVAISDTYLAATIEHPILGASGYYIALIPKINGSFPTCPSVPYIVGTKIWGNYKSFLNCTSLIGGVDQAYSDKISLIPIPSELGINMRPLKLRVDGNIVVIANGVRVYAWIAGTVGSRFGDPIPRWRQELSFIADQGKTISDIALSNGRLAIGVTSSDATGEVHTFSMQFNDGSRTLTLPSTGILSNGMVGFARTLAMNSDTLMVGSSAMTSSSSINPSKPFSEGYVQQYRYSETAPQSGWSTYWIPKDNRLYSSIPITLKMDENTLVVQLQEMTIPLSGTGYYYPYDSTAFANIYFRSTTGEKLFDHGFGVASKRTITKQSISDARPWYYLWEQMTFVNGTKGLDTLKPEVIPDHPIDVSNGNVVVGWKGAKYRVDNYQERQELQSRPNPNQDEVNGYVGLNGGFFLEKTSSLTQ